MLTLHQDCLTRLREKVAEAIPQIEVDYGNFVSPFASAPLRGLDDALPREAKLELTSRIDDFPAETFVMSWIDRRLKEAVATDASAKTVFLSQVEAFKDVEHISKQIIDEFQTLPWAYTATIELPVSFANWIMEAGDSLELSGSVRILVGKALLDGQYPLHCPDEAVRARTYGITGLLGTIEPVWNDESTYFQCEIEGFIDDYARTNAVAQCRQILRSFCGLGIALGTLQRSFLGTTKYSPRFIFHRRVDKSWEVDTSLLLPEPQASGLGLLEAGPLFREARTKEEQRALLRDFVDAISPAFGAEEHSVRLSRAAQWLFDSHVGADPLLQFVQATIVLEILLGNQDPVEDIGLTELLANRCAYLIAGTHEERTKIMEDFKGIYRVRSKIVHTGKNVLSNAEGAMLYQLRQIGMRVLHEELKMATR